MIGYSVNNWKNMPDGKAKYQAYLASREWGLLREQVHARSGGTCERCRHNPGTAVHHRTYERIYRELLADLVHICDPCHEYEHGKRGRDPILDVPVTLMGREVRSVYLAGRITPPLGAWRNQIAPDWGTENHGNDRSDALLPDGRDLNVSGPFWMPTDTYGGHGYYDRQECAFGIHAWGGDYDAADNQGGFYISRLSRIIAQWVTAADVVFAWIDSRECYGTLWELGYAYAFGDQKLIVVATPEFDRELWLPTLTADIRIHAPTAGAAWEKLWSNDHEPWMGWLNDPEEFAKYRDARDAMYPPEVPESDEFAPVDDDQPDDGEDPR